MGKRGGALGGGNSGGGVGNSGSGNTYGGGGGGVGGGSSKSMGSSSTSTGGIQGGNGNSSSGGGSSTPTLVNTPVKLEFGENISEERKKNANFMMAKMPERHRKLLNHRGVRIYVDDRADTSPGWLEYAKPRGITSSSTSADGRPLGTLSFYSAGRAFISDASGTGSANVYVHEMAHALDYHYVTSFDKSVEGHMEVEFKGETKTFTRLSNHPEFVELHNEEIASNLDIRAYYRIGSNRTRESGRSESFAEGYAEYVTHGREGLKNLFKSYEIADKFIEIFKEMGVLD